MYRSLGIRFDITDKDTKDWLDILKSEDLKDVKVILRNKELKRTEKAKSLFETQNVWFVGERNKVTSSIQVYGLYINDVITIKVKGYEDVKLVAVDDYSYNSEYILELIKN